MKGGGGERAPRQGKETEKVIHISEAEWSSDAKLGSVKPGLAAEGGEDRSLPVSLL